MLSLEGKKSRAQSSKLSSLVPGLSQPEAGVAQKASAALLSNHQHMYTPCGQGELDRPEVRPGCQHFKNHQGRRLE